MGMNGCQGTPWSEELDGKELRGALGGERDLELRGPTVSWDIVDRGLTHLSTPSTTSVVLCCFERGGVVRVLLHCFNSTPHGSVFLWRVICAFIHMDMSLLKAICIT